MTYLTVFLLSLLLSLAFTPLMRKAALRLKIMDVPNNSVKTHKEPVPYLGGLAVWLSFFLTMVVLRLTTNFPTGTLHALRGIIYASVLILILGIIDDLHIRGLHYTWKFLIQFIAAGILVLFDIRIKFVQSTVLSVALTLIWIVGITNAFNLIDVMDGLSGSVAAIAALGFFLISLPTNILYVNYGTVVIIGACLGFLPYNLSRKHRIFLGDTGSLFLGFVLAALALGTSYTTVNRISFIAPLLVLTIPIFETLLLVFHRIKKGRSPFMGSKDHFALRLEKMGYSRPVILLMTVSVALFLSGVAFASTRVETIPALGMYVFVVALFILVSLWLGKVEVE
jgi:UDP-GlcNAc:undecaprenyl-phosphate GlcNAc-1-phosphate transferase